MRTLGVLASGTGSILQAIVDAGLPVAVVVADRRCPAIERAEAANIPVEQYNSVRSFFEKIRAAEQAPVVLARK